MNNIRLATAFAACCFSSGAFGGIVMEFATTEYTQQPPVLGTVKITSRGTSSRLEIHSVSSNESGGLIYSDERNAVIALDHARKEYIVIDQEQIDAMAGQVDQAMQQMREALEKMPPEQRVMAERMMQSRMPVKKTSDSRGTLHKTGESDTVAGHDCDYYDITQKQQKLRDICVTRWADIPEGHEMAVAMQQLGKFFKNMTEAFSSAGGLDLMDRQQDMFSYMDEVQGYPVRTREYDEAGELEMETVLKSAVREDVDSAIFDPPKDYGQMQMQ